MIHPEHQSQIVSGAGTLRLLDQTLPHLAAEPDTNSKDSLKSEDPGNQPPGYRELFVTPLSLAHLAKGGTALILSLWLLNIFPTLVHVIIRAESLVALVGVIFQICLTSYHQQLCKLVAGRLIVEPILVDSELLVEDAISSQGILQLLVCVGSIQIQ